MGASSTRGGSPDCQGKVRGAHTQTTGDSTTTFRQQMVILPLVVVLIVVFTLTTIPVSLFTQYLLSQSFRTK